jgi:Flp pilus assembly protein TadG
VPWRLFHRRGQNGQTTTETILWLPFFLFFAFGLIQAGQLGTALIVTNYAASAVARQAVQENGAISGGAKSRFERLLIAGMRNAQLTSTTQSGGLASNITVTACADVPALPFVATFLGRPLGGGGCGSGGLVSLNGNMFTVQGKARARMNYQP